MIDLNCSLRDYSITKALTWGNFREHAFVETKKGSLGHRAVHLIIAAAEFLPIIGQIVSLAEMILVRKFNILQPIRFKSDETDKYFRELMDPKYETVFNKRYTEEDRIAYLELEKAFTHVEPYEKDKRIFTLQGEELAKAVVHYEKFADALSRWDNVMIDKHVHTEFLHNVIRTPLLSLFKLYQQGKAIPENPKREELVIGLASSFDHPESNFLYAECLEKGNQLEKAQKFYYNLYERFQYSKNEYALEAGYRVLTRYPEYVEKEDKFGETLYRLAQLGHPQAKSDYGVDLLAVWKDDLSNVTVTAKNQKDAFSLFKEAAEAGSADAQYNLAVCYSQGIGIESDQQLALEWCQKAVDAGHTQAMTLLGGWISLGFESFNLFKKAADLGNEFAKLHLAYCYEMGYGTAKDTSEAIRCYEELTKKGVYERSADRKFKADITTLMTTAHFRLGVLYLNDPQKIKTAFRKFSDANQWEPYISSYAVLARDRIQRQMPALSEISQNLEVVADWFNRDLMDWSLGFSSARGSRHRWNYLAQRRWHKQLADQGVAAAQFTLAHVHMRGESNEFPKDLAQAKNYLQLAAAQGHFRARLDLKEWRE